MNDLPTERELRQTLGSAKAHWKNYEQTLTAAATGMGMSPTIAQQMELLAVLSTAHADMAAHIEAVRVTLGLPYARVIEVEAHDVVG